VGCICCRVGCGPPRRDSTLTTTRRLASRLPVVVAAAAVPVLLVAGAACAHVTVNAPEATQGGFAKVTFRVPNETDNTTTTKVQVFFPASQPLAAVSIQPHPGWSYRVRTTKLDKPISSDDGSVTQAVSQIVWTADSKASAIKPGEFDEFNVSAGPLPQAPTMVFKTLQTYSDGSVVRWIEPTDAGGEEPEHPAPTLTLAAAGSDGLADTVTTTTAADTSSNGSDSNGRATAALILSIVALLVAIAAAARGLVRRTHS
jgi:periplasmic copper chaperone A